MSHHLDGFFFCLFIKVIIVLHDLYYERKRNQIPSRKKKKKRREKSKRRHVLDYGVFCMDEAALVGEISAVLFDENNHIKVSN
jgi:hypothetical protein